MTKDTNRPAFPTRHNGTGMELRDYFAVKAMQIFLLEQSREVLKEDDYALSDSLNTDMNHNYRLIRTAKASYQMADKMLEARDEE